MYTARCLPRKMFFDPVLEKYLEKGISVLEKSRMTKSTCFSHQYPEKGAIFANRKAFRINLTCSGESQASDMPVLILLQKFYGHG